MRPHIHILILCCLLLSACHSQPEWHIGVSQCSDDEWRRQMNTELLREAKLHDNVHITIRTCNDDSQQQIKDIHELVEQGIDALIVAPNDSKPLSNIISQVYKQGIPVIITDRKINSDNYTCWIGADNYDAAYRLGKYIAEISRDKPHVRILEISGRLGSSTTTERSAGFRHAISSCPNLELAATIDGKYFDSTAEVKTDSLLRTGVEIDIVFAHCDRMANGAYRAIQRHGLKDSVLLFGIDALNIPGCGVDMLAEGKLAASAYYPTGGNVVMQTAIALLSGTPTQHDIWLESPIITKQDVPIMIAMRHHINNLDSQLNRMETYSDLLLGSYQLQRLVIIMVLALLIGVVVFIVLLKRANKKLIGRNLLIEEQKREALELSDQLKEATQAKLMFFTNISHELRTPLTLIADPAKRLLNQSGNITPVQREMLESICSNSDTLLRLVNQLLDFRKYENGKLLLANTRLSLYEAICNWNNSFIVSLDKHGISFRCVCEMDDTTINCDAEKLERIYFNLMSNAIKFTPKGGSIVVTISGDKKNISLAVADSGCGIRSDEMPYICERFYQAAGAQHTTGTGIGLALIKSYVTMHKGELKIDSQEGVGSVFTVILPRNPDTVTAQNQARIPAMATEVAETEEIDDSQVMLVVDDNDEIRRYICLLFNDTYRICEAANGEEALHLATTQIPDIIISDVMMPIIDGNELCSRLKMQMQTSHIPIVLLTACALDEQRIQGYENGADAYISKPFNSEVLKAQVRVLVENCRLRKERWSQSKEPLKQTTMTLNDTFCKRLYTLLEVNIANSEYNVDAIGQDMGLSRMQLYRKIRQIMGFTPNDLLRRIRLEYAHKLLMDSDMSIKEVGFSCGFSSSSYFIKCYRDMYDKTPAETRNNDISE